MLSKIYLKLVHATFKNIILLESIILQTLVIEAPESLQFNGRFQILLVDL